MSNTFGKLLTLTTFGESHGTATGGILTGLPAGVAIDVARIQAQLDRRRPGQSALTTSRNEADAVQLLSGIMDGVSLGTPIGFTIANTNQHSADYEAMRHVYRPGHADFTYDAKYGRRDHRGGGRASARETAARVVGGAIATQLLEKEGVAITARVAEVGGIVNTTAEGLDERCQQAVLSAKAAGDSIGGIVECRATGVPAGLGEPVFGKLQAVLAAAMMSIPAAKGFEYGMGFAGASKHGSEVIDTWVAYPADVRGMHAAANHSGGIQGGISNGEDIVMRVAFKPTATLLRDVDTCNDAGEAVTLHARGRHDPCVAIRAVPVVEAMAALAIADAWLLNRTAKL